MEKTEEDIYAYREEVGASHSPEEHHRHYSHVGTINNSGDKDLVQLPAIRVWRRFYSVLRNSHDSA